MGPISKGMEGRKGEGEGREEDGRRAEGKCRAYL